MIIVGTILSIRTTTVNEATVTGTTSSASTVVQLGGCTVEEGGEGHIVEDGCLTLRFEAPPTDSKGEVRGILDRLRFSVAYDDRAQTYSRAPWR